MNFTCATNSLEMRIDHSFDIEKSLVGAPMSAAWTSAPLTLSLSYSVAWSKVIGISAKNLGIIALKPVMISLCLDMSVARILLTINFLIVLICFSLRFLKRSVSSTNLNAIAMWWYSNG